MSAIRVNGRISHTLQPVLQPRNGGVGVVDNLLELDGGVRVLVGQHLPHVFLIYDFLRHLVRPKAQRLPGTLHDGLGAEAAEDAGLVVLGRMEVCDGDVVGIEQLRDAGARGPAASVPIRSRIAGRRYGSTSPQAPGPSTRRGI